MRHRRGGEGGGVSGNHTYPALPLSSSQPLDWPVLGWALPSHWGRATQNRTPKDQTRWGRKRETGAERKVDGGASEEEEQGEWRGDRRINLKGSVKTTREDINRQQREKTSIV